MLYVSLIFDPVEWNGKQPTPKFQNGLPIAPAKFCFVNNLLKWTEDCQEGGVLQVFLMDPWMIGIESPVVCNVFLLYEVYGTHFVF